MSVVSHYSDRLAVMYAGEIVELGPTRQVFDRPEHPYPRDSWRRSVAARRVQAAHRIAGNPPSLVDPPEGCLSRRLRVRER